MSMKKLILANVVVLVLSAVGNFMIHGMLLREAYGKFPNLLRTLNDSNDHAMFLMVGFLFFTLGFVWIYAQLKQSGSWMMDGLKYAIAVWLIASVSRYAIYYAIQPWSSEVVWMQIGYELVFTLILGAALGFILREQN